MCVPLLIIIVIMIICFLRNSREEFRIEASAGSNMVLTDSDGNLSSIPFPKRIIVLWSGALADIPKGWALCDGDNDTPDLRGRFVIGVNPSDKKSDLTARPMGTKGGAETHTLTPEQIPPHSHGVRYNNACFKNGGCDSRLTMDGGGGFTGPEFTSSVGGGQAHPIMPPYYALAYIMKL